MTNISATARTLADALAARSIQIKHVQALDLIAAGAGLANRHILSTLSQMPRVKRVNIALLTSAATILAQHDLSRRQTIIDVTSETLLPTSNPKSLIEEALTSLATVLPSLGEDEDTPGGAVRKWIEDAQKQISSDEDLEELLAEGYDVILNIAGMLDGNDHLRTWLDKAEANIEMHRIIKIDANGKPLSIKPRELTDPDTFLDTHRGREFMRAMTHEMGYERYSNYGSQSMSLSQGNILGEAILDAKRESPPEDLEFGIDKAFVDTFGEGNDVYNVYWSEYRSDVEFVIESLRDEVAELDLEIEIDVEDWMSALDDHIPQILADEDDSNVRSLIDRYDHCEVVFFFTPEGHLIDNMIASNRPWADFEDLHVGPELQHALSCLGYNLDDYRLISGNHNPGEDLLRGLRKRQERLLPPDKLKEIVENACSQWFLFCLYAVVPVQDLVNLDLTKPITFSQAAIATYNPFSGTFMDNIIKRPITVTPKEGVLHTGARGISPDSICGLHLPAYYASIKNEAPAAAKAPINA